MKRDTILLTFATVMTLLTAMTPVGRLSAALTQEQRDALLAELAERGDVDVSFSNALMYKGLALFTEKEYEAAIPYLEEAIEMDPSLFSAWEGLGWAYWRIDEQDQAVDLWTRMLQIAPKKAMPYNLLAQAAANQGRWIDADGFFRKSLNINPDQFDVRLWFSQNLLRIGKHKEAMRIVRALLREDPDRIDIAILLARMLSYSQEYDESAELWRRITQELPDNPDLMIEHANIEMQVGELTTADDLCAQVCALDPANERALTLRADIAEVADMGELTVERLEELLEVVTDPKVRATLRVRIATRCRVINERKSKPVYSTSFILGQYEKAIEDDPEHVPHFLAYAGACFMTRHFAKARDLAEHVLEKFNAHNQPAMELLFNVELALGAFDRAEQILEARYNDFEKNSPARLYDRARVLMMRGEYEAALNQLDEMDRRTSKGCVFTLLYHQLTESEWMPITSSRRFYEHLSALQREGFEFIAPDKIIERLTLMQEQEEERLENQMDEPPVLARWIDSARYALTGERRFGKKYQPSTGFKPSKCVAITFDDGFRNAFVLGAPVAEAFNVPFAMFAITKEPDTFAPAYSSWSEIMGYAATGNWIIGSHLEEAHELLPVDAEGKNKRHALPNRVWNKEKNRLESMNEWDRRMRRNFRVSRKSMRDRLGENDLPNAMVAYPFGDIGQTEGCNITAIKNPMQSIMSEAARSFSFGFVLSDTGYSCAGVNPMLIARYEPMWFDEGDDVVRHAYLGHPYFVSRRLRINIAYLQNKPHLAKTMLKELRENGYPSDLCREIEVETFAHFTQKPSRVERPLVRQRSYDTIALVPVKSEEEAEPSTASTVAWNNDSQTGFTPDQRAIGAGGGTPTNTSGEQEVVIGDEDRPWVKLNSAYLGVELWDAKANGDFTYNRYGVLGGFNLNQRSSFSAEFFTGVIKQKTTLTADNPDYDPGANTSLTNRPYVSRPAQYRAERTDFRVRYSYRYDSGAVFAASLGTTGLSVDEEKSSNFWLDPERSFTIRPGEDPFSPRPEIEDGNTVVGSLSYTFYPLETLRFSAYYLHDVVSTGFKLLFYDSMGFNLRILLSDRLNSNVTGQYWIYDDDNSVFFGSGDLFYNTHPDLGLWAGVQASVTTASKDNNYYWAPYWDQRFDFILRYRKEYAGFFFNLDMILAMQREDARASDSLAQPTDWERGYGFGISFRRRFWGHLDWYLDARTLFLHGYGDHSLRTGGIYNF